MKKHINQDWEAITQATQSPNGGKLQLYNKIKTHISQETYLYLKNSKHRQCIAKLRTSAHCLAIETGRYQNQKPEERICKFCNLGDKEDETHFLLKCPLYNNIRNQHLTPILEKNPQTLSLAAFDKTVWLLAAPDLTIQQEIGKYCYLSFNLRYKVKIGNNIT